MQNFNFMLMVKKLETDQNRLFAEYCVMAGRGKDIKFLNGMLHEKCNRYTNGFIEIYQLKKNKMLKFQLLRWLKEKKADKKSGQYLFEGVYKALATDEIENQVDNEFCLS